MSAVAAHSYRLASGDNLVNLEKAVNQALAAGWQVLGPPFLTHDNRAVQALILPVGSELPPGASPPSTMNSAPPQAAPAQQQQAAPPQQQQAPAQVAAPAQAPPQRQVQPQQAAPRQPGEPPQRVPLQPRV